MNFKIFLGSIFAFFVAILIVCYVIARQANPVFLDDHGRPTATAAKHGS